MNIRQTYLIIATICLVPVGLFFGVIPQQILGIVFDISITNTNGKHIFRALMGLYLGFALFWFIGAFNITIRQAALYSLGVLMFGLAAGRTLSLIIDGMPHWILTTSLILEIILGSIAFLLTRRAET